MTTKKSFFKEKTIEEIKDLNTKDVYRPQGLVKKIDDLSNEEALVVRFQILSGKFYRGNLSGSEANRKAYKHGDLVRLRIPKTQWEIYRMDEIPLAVRAIDLGKLTQLREEENNFIGFDWYPVQNDRQKRKIPFAWIPEGHKIFAYSEQLAGGIEVLPSGSTKEDKSKHAQRIGIEGETIVCRVPSRTQKKSRYEIKLEHVPVDGVTQRRAIAWSLRSQYAEGRAPKHQTLGNIRYTYEDDLEGSNIFTFYPHDIAAYIAVIKHYNDQHKLTPIEMSVIPLISKHGAQFSERLNNNLLVYDPSVQRKDHLRKPHIAEKSILFSRAIGEFGHDDILFWDPARDGYIKNYFK